MDTLTNKLYLRIPIALFTLLFFTPLFADDNSLIPSVNYPLYLNECGDCHLAYQPLFLPQAAWQRIMTTLDNHFGDNAELEEETVRNLTAYLLVHSAEHSSQKLATKLLKSTENQLIIRITELPYFKKEHDEIPARLVTDNPQVKSFSHCDKCHTKASFGNYEEDSIEIAGYGRWDD